MVDARKMPVELESEDNILPINAKMGRRKAAAAISVMTVGTVPSSITNIYHRICISVNLPIRHKVWCGAVPVRGAGRATGKNLANGGLPDRWLVIAPLPVCTLFP